MAISLGELIERIEELAPPRYAEAWDSVGLQVGCPEDEVERVLLAVDVTTQVVDELVRKEGDALVAHHPLLFGEVRSVRSDRWPGCVISALIEARCSLYVAHTNVDAAPRTNSSAALAEALGLQRLRPLSMRMPDDLAVVVAEVDGGHVEGLTSRLSRAGLDARCSGAEAGAGSSLEVVCARARLAEAIELLMAEASARVRDVRPVLGRPPFPGLGVLAECEPMTVEGLAAGIRSALGLKSVRLSEAGGRMVEGVAVVAGSAKGMLGQVAASGAQALVAGEIGHHLAIEATESGIAAVEVGHFASELPAMRHLAALLRRTLGEKVTIEVSAEQGRPFADI
jgi:dinuclear metal center YbgI/SA1388 family protein